MSGSQQSPHQWNFSAKFKQISVRNSTAQFDFADFSDFMERILSTDASEQAVSIKICGCYNHQGVNNPAI